MEVMNYAEYHKEPGVFNTEADGVPRIDRSWSDTNPFWSKGSIPTSFDRMVCRNCGNKSFEVILSQYEVLTKCNNCKMYYTAYSG